MRMMSSPANRRLAAIVLTIACACFACPPQASAQGRCGAGVDLVVQALEKMSANASRDELGDADQLLKRAAELCGELGDAWYYRSLVETKLGNPTQAAFAMRQAQKFPSDASQEQLNPFVLATPVLTAGSRAVNGPAAAAPGANSGPPGQRWALIVGISTFTDPNIQRLKYTASDAQSFQDALLEHNPNASLFDILEDIERRIILEKLERCNGNQTDAAEQFHIPLSTLNQKIKRLNIEIHKKGRE